MKLIIDEFNKETTIDRFKGKSYGKNSATILQAKVWFALVSSIENKKSYGLDTLFAIDEQRDGTERLRMFENAEKGMLISRGNHPKRNFDLISVVDAKPNYSGSKMVFDSPFWLLLYGIKPLFRMETFRCFLVECITLAQNSYKCSNEANTTNRFFEFNSQITYSNKPPRKIKVPIPNYLLGEPSFDILAVIGGLYREAYLSCSDHYASALKEFFLERLFDLLKSRWLTDDLKKEIFRLSHENILCPINQYTRNKAPSIQIDLAKDHCSADQIEFIKLHNKYARQKFD